MEEENNNEDDREVGANEETGSIAAAGGDGREGGEHQGEVLKESQVEHDDIGSSQKKKVGKDDGKVESKHTEDESMKTKTPSRTQGNSRGSSQVSSSSQDANNEAGITSSQSSNQSSGAGVSGGSSKKSWLSSTSKKRQLPAASLEPIEEDEGDVQEPSRKKPSRHGVEDTGTPFGKSVHQDDGDDVSRQLTPIIEPIVATSTIHQSPKKATTPKPAKASSSTSFTPTASQTASSIRPQVSSTTRSTPVSKLTTPKKAASPGTTGNRFDPSTLISSSSKATSRGNTDGFQVGGISVSYGSRRGKDVQQASSSRPVTSSSIRITGVAPSVTSGTGVGKGVGVNVARGRRGGPPVPLEENLVSYWDFVNPSRGDRLIRHMAKRRANRRGTSSSGATSIGMSSEVEQSLRTVQRLFFTFAEAKFRPDDQYIDNPHNPALLESIAIHRHVLELLHKENEELEKEVKGLKLSVNNPSSLTTTNVNTSTSNKKQTKDKSVLTIEDRSSMDSYVASFVASLPPAEENLLDEEDRMFLDRMSRFTRSTSTATVGSKSSSSNFPSSLDLPSFSRLQTKLDAMELLSKMIEAVNVTFEEKAIEVSSSMRSAMIPSSNAPFDFSRLVPSSPSIGTSEFTTKPSKT